MRTNLSCLGCSGEISPFPCFPSEHTSPKPSGSTQACSYEISLETEAFSLERFAAEQGEEEPSRARLESSLESGLLEDQHNQILGGRVGAPSSSSPVCAGSSSQSFLRHSQLRAHPCNIVSVTFVTCCPHPPGYGAVPVHTIPALNIYSRLQDFNRYEQKQKSIKPGFTRTGISHILVAETNVQWSSSNLPGTPQR